MRILFKNLLLNKNIMRRRTAPRQMPPPPPQSQQRMPQPSIKSSQVFSAHQGQYQQTQQMDPRKQQYRGNQNDYSVENTSSSKMSLAQAITLITLRLGSLETKIMNGEIGQSINSIDGESLGQFDERINSLEEKLNSLSTNNYKQQIDQLAETIIQSKHLLNSLAKDNKELRTELFSLKKQFSNIKNTVLEIEQLARSNENKIFQMFKFDGEEDIEFEGEEDIEKNVNSNGDEEPNVCEDSSLHENIYEEDNNLNSNDNNNSLDV